MSEQAEAEIAITLLTRSLASQWRESGPKKLNQIAELMGKHAAHTAIDGIPKERQKIAILARIRSRTEDAERATGAELVSLIAEIRAYTDRLSTCQ
jgi:hypothetical protein